MKGVVFTELMEMVEAKFSEDVADEILDAANLKSGGSYTSLGSYDHSEILELVSHLSRVTKTDASELVKAFGTYLFSRFVEMHSEFFDGINNAMDFLEKVDGYIHLEVRKLYPDAELPSLDCERPDPAKLTMHYRSTRPFADLAEGLIKGCIAHFNENTTIEREDLAGSGPGTEAKFVLVTQ